SVAGPSVQTILVRCQGGDPAGIAAAPRHMVEVLYSTAASGSRSGLERARALAARERATCRPTLLGEPETLARALRVLRGLHDRNGHLRASQHPGGNRAAQDVSDPARAPGAHDDLFAPALGS